jgi:hypothetical protein
MAKKVARKLFVKLNNGFFAFQGTIEAFETHSSEFSKHFLSYSAPSKGL